MGKGDPTLLLKSQEKRKTLLDEEHENGSFSHINLAQHKALFSPRDAEEHGLGPQFFSAEQPLE